MGPPQIPPKDYGYHHSTNNSNSFLSPNTSNARILTNSKSSLNSIGSYVDQDLAEAVRDSVQINTPKPTSATTRHSILLDTRSTNNASSITSKQPPLPSLNPLVPRRTPSPNVPPQPQTQNNMSVFQPTHNYSHSSPDMTTIAQSLPQQPSLPSARMSQLAPQNPFEDDEIEPAGNGRIQPPGNGHQPTRSFGGSSLESEGLIQPNRAKFNRSQTG